MKASPRPGEKSRRIVIAAGGTAGHVFPGLALYQELTRRGFSITLITDRRAKHYADLFTGAQVEVFPAGGLVTGSILRRALNLGRLGWASVSSFALLRRIRPVGVVGMGGYPSVGPLIAAQMLAIPTVLHEQNSVMGKANRFVARRAKAVALTFDSTERALGHLISIGNPIRADIVDIGLRDYSAPSREETITVLVMGGSLGATEISEVVPAALATLDVELRQRLSVVHQARDEDLEIARAAYDAAGIESRVVPFVDVPKELMDSHLVIARSGASTVTEVAAARRPAIYIPLLAHGDQQQLKNAQAVATVGGALVHRTSGASVSSLATMIEQLVLDQGALTEMANASFGWIKPDAAANLADLVERTVETNRHRRQT